MGDRAGNIRLRAELLSDRAVLDGPSPDPESRRVCRSLPGESEPAIPSPRCLPASSDLCAWDLWPPAWGGHSLRCEYGNSRTDALLALLVRPSGPCRGRGHHGGEPMVPGLVQSLGGSRVLLADHSTC